MFKVLKAIKFATDKHNGQTRKVSGEPYVTHPLAVSYIVASAKVSKHKDDLLCAALLHDVLEDTDATFAEIASMFGPMVATIVFELTNDQEAIDKIGKLEYHKQKLVGISSYALVIKLADRLHNMMDSPTDKMKADTRSLIEHLEQNRKLSSAHKKLIEQIKETL